MKTRIEQILTEYNLTPSKFADELGIQRSGMSHILSGRNNPSLDLIQKILKRFPEINADWILTGKGNIKGNLKPIESPIDLFATSLPIQTKIERPEIESASINVEPESKRIFSSLDKKVERIIIFYTDRTFKEYKSEE